MAPRATLSYTHSGDGTITDNNTGLVWEKKSDDGSIHDKDTSYTWDNAFAVHVAGLNTANFAGHNDCGVPNVKELPEHRELRELQPGGVVGVQQQLRGELHGADVLVHVQQLLLVVRYEPGLPAARVGRELQRRGRGHVLQDGLHLFSSGAGWLLS